MLVARIIVSKSEIETRSLAPITAGMVGAEVEVLFDSTWAGFSKTFVWSHDEVVINDLNASGRIPAEVLAKCGGLLNFGVYGTKEGEVMPTVWTAVGTVNVGTDPSGDESTDPALPAWAQLQEKIEQIKNKDSDYLTSADLDSAVADALAEAKSSGEFDGYTPLKGTDYYTQEDKSEIVAEVREAVEDTGIRNPNTLTFTGAVTGSYDGSAPLNVEIPAVNDADWEFITKLTQEGTTADYYISQNDSGEAFSYDELALFITPTEAVNYWKKIQINSDDLTFADETKVVFNDYSAYSKLELGKNYVLFVRPNSGKGYLSEFGNTASILYNFCRPLAVIEKITSFSMKLGAGEGGTIEIYGR